MIRVIVCCVHSLDVAQPWVGVKPSGGAARDFPPPPPPLLVWWTLRDPFMYSNKAQISVQFRPSPISPSFFGIHGSILRLTVNLRKQHRRLLRGAAQGLPSTHGRIVR